MSWLLKIWEGQMPCLETCCLAFAFIWPDWHRARPRLYAQDILLSPQTEVRPIHCRGQQDNEHPEQAKTNHLNVKTAEDRPQGVFGLCRYESHFACFSYHLTYAGSSRKVIVSGSAMLNVGVELVDYFLEGYGLWFATTHMAVYVANYDFGCTWVNSETL